MSDALGRSFGSATCPVCETVYERTSHRQVRCLGCKTRRRIRCEWCCSETIVARHSSPVRRSTGHQFPRTCSPTCAARLASVERNPSSPWPRPVKPPTDCQWCGRTTGSPHRSYCSRACNEIDADPRRARATPIQYGTCRECGTLFVGRAEIRKSFCSEPCASKAAHRTRRHRERSAGMRTVESITLREVADRDGWRCHLCGNAVPDRPFKSRPHDATIDHLIPLANDGQHTWDNVALAHFRCNSQRGATGPAQLRLVG